MLGRPSLKTRCRLFSNPPDAAALGGQSRKTSLIIPEKFNRTSHELVRRTYRTRQLSVASDLNQSIFFFVFHPRHFLRDDIVNNLKSPSTFLILLVTLVLAASNLVNAQTTKIGYIEWRESKLPDILDSLTTRFPVAAFEKTTLSNNIADHGLDAVVDEMDTIVLDMQSRGIDRIMIAASSAETGPFIEGSAGSLGGVHSDVRHPNVIFAADRQGTSSVDNAQNWYRAGIDFVTDKVLGAPVLLPDVTGISPQPQFILATDNSPAVDQANIPFSNQATAAGYEVVSIDMGWNEATNTFDSFSALGPALTAAPPNSKVGLSFSAAPSNDDTQPFVRWVEMTKEGLADPNVFDPANDNVDYLSLNYGHFLGDFDDPGSIPVDLQIGVGAAPALISDPTGVNPFLVEQGYPNDPIAARAYDDETYGGSGIVSVATFAWLATEGAGSLDPRHRIDENRQLVEYYVEDVSFPAGATWDEPLLENLRVNPRWSQVPEPSSNLLALAGAIGLLYCTRGNRRRRKA